MRGHRHVVEAVRLPFCGWQAVPPLLDSMPGELFLKVRQRSPSDATEDNDGDDGYPTSGG